MQRILGSFLFWRRLAWQYLQKIRVRIVQRRSKMIDRDKSFLLPGKIESLLATLNRLYERTSETLLRRILVNGKVSIHEEWDYDGWDGGIYGHAVTLTVPEQLYLEIMDEKDTYQERVCRDLNKINNVRQEHVSAVFVEMQASDDHQWREESGLFFSNPRRVRRRLTHSSEYGDLSMFGYL